MKNVKICVGVLVVMVFMLIAADSLAQMSAKAPDALTVIHSRKSVRNFTGQPVSREDLDKILRAGMAAPTAVEGSPGHSLL